MRTYQKMEADISDCGLYRYSLTRVWNEDEMPIVFIGLNPSTADGQKDDATMRRVVDFAKAAGHGSVIMLNLFAFRSSSPAVMAKAMDPIGPRNDEVLRRYSRLYCVVASWGNETRVFVRKRAELVQREMLSPPIWCLGLTASRCPRHPLYVKSGTAMRRYD